MRRGRERGRLRTRIPAEDARQNGLPLHGEGDARDTTVTLKRIQFHQEAWDDVLAKVTAEAEEVMAIARGAGDVVATTRTGSLTLAAAAGGALAITLNPLDTEAGRRVRELVDAGVEVYARPVIDFDGSEYEIDGETALIRSADFRYILVKPTDRTEGLDPLEGTTREGRGLSMRRRRLLLA